MKTDFDVKTDFDGFEASDLTAVVAAAITKKKMEFKVDSTTCGGCGETFRYRYLIGGTYTVPAMCGPCYDAEHEKKKIKLLCARETAAKRRRQDVPTKYADNDTGQFPPQWSDILRWNGDGGRGIGLIGPTGVCKTRMMFELLMNHREQTATNFKAMTAFRFQQLTQNQWVDPVAKEEVRAAIRAKILFLDDFGKQKFTESVEAEFFELIEERSKWFRPLCFTSNLTGAELKGKMSENVSGPLLRRLREDCDIYMIQ